ncbi:MAG: hypothetical protein LBS32_07610 [Clostridiales Family XIII bacterium]|nr:hypothetical protein [Clostridiales Family XIII bacterium]
MAAGRRPDTDWDEADEALLEGITLGDLIGAMRRGCREMTAEAAERELERLLAARLAGMRLAMGHDMAYILDEAGRKEPYFGR